MRHCAQAPDPVRVGAAGDVAQWANSSAVADHVQATRGELVHREHPVKRVA